MSVRLATTVAAVTLLAGCSGGEAAPPASSTPTTTESPSAEPSPTPTPRYVEVTAATCLNIREEPTLEAAVIGCAPAGTVLQRTGGPRLADGHRWVRVAGAWNGWAAGEFLERTDPPDEEP